MQRRLLTIVASVVLVAGCSFSGSIGGKKVSTDELEKQVAAQSADNDLITSSVDCPAGLDVTVGAVAQCTVIANELKYTATVKATSVEGDTVLFDLKIPPPAIVPQETLEAEVASLVESKTNAAVALVTCKDEMIGTTGTAVECTVERSDGQVLQVVATVTEADFLNVNFSLDEKA